MAKDHVTKVRFQSVNHYELMLGKVRELFEAFDSDADDSLSLNEVAKLMEDIGNKITCLPAVRILAGVLFDSSSLVCRLHKLHRNKESTLEKCCTNLHAIANLADLTPSLSHGPSSIFTLAAWHTLGMQRCLISDRTHLWVV